MCSGRFTVALASMQIGRALRQDIKTRRARSREVNRCAGASPVSPPHDIGQGTSISGVGMLFLADFPAALVESFWVSNSTWQGDAQRAHQQVVCANWEWTGRFLSFHVSMQPCPAVRAALRGWRSLARGGSGWPISMAYMASPSRLSTYIRSSWLFALPGLSFRCRAFVCRITFFTKPGLALTYYPFLPLPGHLDPGRFLREAGFVPFLTW